MLDEARDRIVAQYGYGEEATRSLELETVRVSIATTRTFPFVAQREAAGKLTLRGAYFAIRAGAIWAMAYTGGLNPGNGGAAQGTSLSATKENRGARKRLVDL